MNSNGNKVDIEFSSEDAILRGWLQNHQKLEGTTNGGAYFWGILRNFDETRLFLEGQRGQTIIVRRAKIAHIEAI